MRLLHAIGRILLGHLKNYLRHQRKLRLYRTMACQCRTIAPVSSFTEPRQPLATGNWPEIRRTFHGTKS